MYKFIVTVLLLLAGLLQAWGVANPWTGDALWWLQLLGMALGVVAVGWKPPAGATGKARWWLGARRTWLWATTWLTASIWWLYISMHTYGGMPSWMAALAVLLLASALGVLYAIAGGCWAHCRARLGRLASTTLFAALWTLAELTRGTLFTGFPWAAVGYAHVEGPLALLAPWVGVYGIGFLAAWLAAEAGLELVAAVQRDSNGRHPWVRRSITFVMWGALVVAFAYSRDGIPVLTKPMPTGTSLSVSLLQGNIPQNEKFQPNGGVRTALHWYGEQLIAADADLVVTPETALPMMPEFLPDNYWQVLQKRYAQGNTAALIGVPAGNAQLGYANAVVGMAPKGAKTTPGEQVNLGLPPAQHAEYRYAKHHLVPFGEFIPPGFRWFVDMMQMPLGDFQRGAAVQPRLVWRGHRIQPNICYEDLFGEELAAAFVDAANAPTILVNVSNIAWFGDTIAIDQHRNISRMRAMELGRPMLRATNTGSTAIIDPDGKVWAELPRHQRAVLVGDVEGYTGNTPFTEWAGRWGQWPLVACMALLALGLMGISLRRQP